MKKVVLIFLALITVSISSIYAISAPGPSEVVQEVRVYFPLLNDVQDKVIKETLFEAQKNGIVFVTEASGGESVWPHLKVTIQKWVMVEGLYNYNFELQGHDGELVVKISFSSTKTPSSYGQALAQIIHKNWDH